MRQIRRLSQRLSAVSLLVVALTLAACSDDGGEPLGPIVDPLVGATADQVIALELRDVSFSDDELTVTSGMVVAFDLNNVGRLDHDFTIKEITADVSAVGQQRREKFDVYAPLDGKSETRLLLRVNEPGEYEFFCSLPGHRPSGMLGTLTVVAANP